MSRGGARPGSGRKKKEPTFVMRIPVSLVDDVKKMIDDARLGSDKHFNDVSNDIACDGFNTSIERQCVRYSAPDLIPVKAESLKDTLNSSLAVGAYFAKKEKSNINKKSSKRKKRK